MKRLITFIVALFATSLTFGAGLTQSTTNGFSIDEQAVNIVLSNSTAKGTFNLSNASITLPATLKPAVNQTNLMLINSNGVPFPMNLNAIIGIAGGGIGDLQAI